MVKHQLYNARVRKSAPKAHVLIFNGEDPEVILCESMEEVLSRVATAFQWEKGDKMEFVNRLADEESWCLDNRGRLFQYRIDIGETETVFIYPVYQGKKRKIGLTNYDQLGIVIVFTDGVPLTIELDDDIVSEGYNDDQFSFALLLDGMAESIAEALFTNGKGETADRLVLELPGERDGGGWSKAAVIGTIRRVLKVQARA